MAKIYVDNKDYDVRDGQNLLQACLSVGLNVPYFCWHPALGSVGACRQCAVKQFKNEHDTKGKLVMSCMTPAAEGTRVSIDDAEAVEFRARVIEWLMTNHPHDCPVCDEGGECHLQDMTVMTGHTYRRYSFAKRTYRNQNLGPYVTHEMNRCIQCYRCVRFYRDLADGRDLNVFGWHNHVYFGREADGRLESPFSGNLVEICPTGVFTDKTLARHYTRKWDFDDAPSICTQCGVGCNTIACGRYGELRRLRNRYNDDVNGYFLCDRGRYGYEFVNSPQRLRAVLRKEEEEEAADHRGTETTEVTVHDAVASLRGVLAGARRVMGVVSPRASLESIFALRRLVGPANLLPAWTLAEGATIGRALELLRAGPARSASLRDVVTSDAVLVLGEDVGATAPMVEFAIRQAARVAPRREACARLKLDAWHDYAVRHATQNARGPLFVLTPAATRLDDIATAARHDSLDHVAALGQAVARELNQRPAAAGGMGVSPMRPKGVSPLADRTADGGVAQSAPELATRIAQTLLAAHRPVIVTGTSCGNAAVLEAAHAVAAALVNAGKPATLCIATAACNSMGLALAIQPPTLPRDIVPRNANLAAVAPLDVLVIVETDLYEAWPREQADALLASAKYVIALDHSRTPTTDKAHLVFPAATFAECSGTLVNNEGRAQRFFQVLAPPAVPSQWQVQPSWRWIRDMLVAAGRASEAPWSGLDDVLADMAAELPQLAGAAAAAPPGSFRELDQRVPREPHRYSGRTAMFANQSVHEPPVPPDLDSPLAFSMQGYGGQPPAPLATHFWAPGWNSIQALTRFQQEIPGPLRGGPSGVRLVEPDEGETPSRRAGGTPATPPPAARPTKGETPLGRMGETPMPRSDTGETPMPPPGERP